TTVFIPSALESYTLVFDTYPSAAKVIATRDSAFARLTEKDPSFPDSATTFPFRESFTLPTGRRLLSSTWPEIFDGIFLSSFWASGLTVELTRRRDFIQASPHQS